jgi:hypothetical protein
MNDIRMGLQKHIGTDRDKLLQTEADIKAGTADCDVSFQINFWLRLEISLAADLQVCCRAVFFWQSAL